MAADNDTNSGSGHPSIQIQGKGGRDDREGEGNGGNSKPNDAAPEVGEGRRQRHASKSRRICNNNGNNGNLKVFRRLNNPHPRKSQRHVSFKDTMSLPTSVRVKRMKVKESIFRRQLGGGAKAQ